MNQNYRPKGFGQFSLFPPVIKYLLMINLSIFLFYNLFGEYHIGSISIYGIVTKYFYLYPLGWQGEGGFQIWQLLSYQFLHGGFGHVFFNLFALWMFGSEIENEWGSQKFLFYYLLCGIGAGLTQLFISPLITSTGPTIGASGSVFGVLLAFALTYPNRTIMIFPIFIPIKAKFVIIGLVGLDLLLGFTANTSIAHFAHIGGAATGFLLIKYGEKFGIYSWLDKYNSPNATHQESNFKSSTYEQARIFKVDWEASKKKENTVQTEVKPQVEKNILEEVTQKQIDEILDKISESGYQNLTEREKKILYELSQKLK